jgi:hypothetical protein
MGSASIRPGLSAPSVTGFWLPVLVRVVGGGCRLEYCGWIRLAWVVPAVALVSSGCFSSRVSNVRMNVTSVFTVSEFFRIRIAEGL